jgi:hypothetical protein
MISPKNNIRRNVVVLVSAVVGGLNGLLLEEPTSWSQLVFTIISNGIAWAALTYWALVWLWPRRMRGTPIGALMGAAIFLVVFSLLPDLAFSGPYGRVGTISVDVFFGTLIGALAGTAPRGALIGGGIGAVVAWGVYFVVAYGDKDSSHLVYMLMASLGLLAGAVLGAYLELDKRGKVTRPHP